MQTDVIREEQLNVRMTPAELKLARDVADHFGQTPAGLVRMLIREKARELGIEVPPVERRSAKKR